MSTQSRMKRLYPGLTALERALLVLQSWKQGADEDPQVRHTMPAYQIEDFNRCIDLMNGVNLNLGPYILLVRALSERTSVRLGWLCTLRLWTIDTASIGFAAFRAAREPISESDYKERLDRERAESVPLREFAELLAEREIDDDATERESKRAVAGRARIIEEAIDSGAVAAHRRGRRLLVDAGSFYDWLGEPVPVYPEWGFEYDVRPDGEDITTLKGRFHGLREALQQSRAGLDLTPEFSATEADEKSRFGDDMSHALEDAIRTGLVRHRQELAAIELVVGEVTEEFAGEDPLLPQVRTVLDELKATVDDLHESMASAGIDVEMAEHVPELVDQVRMIVRRDFD